MKKKKRNASAKEMGDWYDKHEVSVERKYDPTLTLRIPRDDLRRLKDLADAKGLPTATLARQLLLERLRLRDDPRPAALELLRALLEWPQLLGILRELLDHPESKDARKTAIEALEGLSA